MIDAKVILDSISPAGKRLASMQITAHRWILAEINTHRVLSRNYRSSRAVPVRRLLEEVRANPAEPVEWRKNQAGMQAGALMTEAEADVAKSIWLSGADAAAWHAERLAGASDLHKQWANRGLEPYLYVHGIITATEWDNFFALRAHPAAQPEFRVLAEKMQAALKASTPKLLRQGEWHLPYIDDQDWAYYPPDIIEGGDGYDFDQAVDNLIKVSVARCARVTNKVFDADRRSYHGEDIALHDKLLKDTHMSPFEHQATPDYWENPAPEVSPLDFGWHHPELHGNFTGFIQYRKTIPGEAVAKFSNQEFA